MLKPDQILILYDGVCGLCHRLNRFLLARDTRDRFRFAALQSELGRDLLIRHGKDPLLLDTFYALLHPGTAQERLVGRGRGALIAVSHLGGIWRVLGALRWLPTFVLNGGYHLVAKHRYRLFGKYQTCPVPPPEHREKFLTH